MMAVRPIRLLLRHLAPQLRGEAFQVAEALFSLVLERAASVLHGLAKKQAVRRGLFVQRFVVNQKRVKRESLRRGIRSR